MRHIASLSTVFVLCLTAPWLLLSSTASAVTPPYVEGFESEPTCGTSCSTICTLSTTGWTNATTDDRDWLVDLGGTSSVSTGPGVDHTLGTAAGKYLYVETSSPCNTAMGVTALISPPLELGATTAPVATFWYHMYGVDQGSLHVDVLDASLAVLATDVIPVVAGDQGNQWFKSAGINLAPFVGNGTVRVRIRHVHSGLGYFGDAAIDDFTFFDNSVDEVTVTMLAGETPPVYGAIPPRSGPVLVGGLQLGAFGPTAHDLVSVTVTNAGNAADGAVTWGLHLDDGDGVFDASDNQLGTYQPQVGGVVVFTPTAVSIPILTSATLWLTAAVQAGASAGETFAASVAVPGSDLVFSTNPAITALNPPIQGDTFTIGAQAMLPFADDFGQASPALRDIVGPGWFPAAQSTATPPTVSAFVTSSQIEMLSSWNPLVPVDGNGLLGVGFPNGTAVAAVQYSFDLSALSAQTDPLWLFVRYADMGMVGTDQDGIFLSGDGGVTWDLMLHKLTWAGPTGQWQEHFSDLSAALSSAGLDYTDNFVIRVQGGANGALGTSGMLIDAVIVAPPPQMALERPASVVIADGSTDDLGVVPTEPTSVTYEIHNTGGFPLQLGMILPQNVSNFASIQVSAPLASAVAPGASEPLVVDFEPLDGPFTFSLVITAEDPALGDDTYTITAIGEGITLAPEIDVQRPAGVSLPSGSVDDQSSVPVGQAQSLSYSIANSGTAELSVGPISVTAATSNVEATVTTPLAGAVAPGDATMLGLQYTVSEAGAFSFDVVIVNDDADEAPYTITVSGEGTESVSPDAGAVDAGAVDAGAVDAGTVDAGTGDGDPGDEGGCGCQARGSRRDIGWLGLALLALGMLLRRRAR